MEVSISLYHRVTNYYVECKMEDSFEWIPKENPFHDYLVYAIVCIEDDSILIENTERNGADKQSLISTTLKRNEGWNDAARRLASDVSNTSKENNVINSKYIF